ncbi:hypothetical protein [Paramicrobacterium agarici]|nr:hypothetical protein [Microbacterium agarici]
MYHMQAADRGNGDEKVIQLSINDEEVIDFIRVVLRSPRAVER